MHLQPGCGPVLRWVSGFVPSLSQQFPIKLFPMEIYWYKLTISNVFELPLILKIIGECVKMLKYRPQIRLTVECLHADRLCYDNLNWCANYCPAQKQALLNYTSVDWFLKPETKALWSQLDQLASDRRVSTTIFWGYKILFSPYH